MSTHLAEATRAAAVPPFRAMAMSRAAVVINSFSKYCSMTGWRLGWMVVPEHLAGAVERLQQHLYICAPHVSQVAGLAAFEGQVELDVASADGAFSVYAEVGHITDDPRVGGSVQLCERWLDELGVAATPGLDFDLARGNRTVRFSYAGERADLVEACDRIAGWAP